MGSNKNTQEDIEFDWIKIQKEASLTDPTFLDEETATEKFNRKFKENPLVPIGAVLTTACLTYGLVCMKRGDTRMSQMMMRARVLAQGFTIVAIVGGLYVKATSSLSSNK